MYEDPRVRSMGMTCGRCTTYVNVVPDPGELYSRHFGTQIKNLNEEDLYFKAGDPKGWLNHLIRDVQESGIIFDPMALVVRHDGLLEIREGNHRAWIAHAGGYRVSANVFRPVCGVCTEARFIDAMNEFTRAKGWLYHQQGF